MSLEVDHVTKRFKIRKGFRSSDLVAVNDVSFSIQPGQTVALVGESGSGKSTIAKMILRLEQPTQGSIKIDGVDSREGGMRNYRRLVQMVFQDPFASLNPYHSIGHHIERPLRLHKKVSGKQETREMVAELLKRVNLDPHMADRRPHELSGGQRQRVAIARALAADPDVLICDEITSALDAATGESIMNLLTRLRKQHGLALVLISHDLPLIADRTDTVTVLESGRTAETGPTADVFATPRHPATHALLATTPRTGP